MKLTVVGTGYVGLVSGVCFADLGNEVICVDIDAAKIEGLKQGVMPIYERDLEEMSIRNHAAGRLSFTTDIAQGVREADVIFIAVGTPSLPGGQADLSQVETVARDIGRYINGYKIVVNNSTVPVGSQKLVKRIIRENMTEEVPFDVVSKPEFLREGSAVFDTMNADRIVIGSDSEKAAEIMTELHKPLSAPIMITSPESAEMIKYASNAFLATKISFINEIANICEQVGANVSEVARGMGMDQRISDKFLSAGLGFGGACFPKDTCALVEIARQAGCEMKTVKSAIEVNKKQRLKPVAYLEEKFESLQGIRVAIWGLAFKPNTDDMREAPSIDIIEALKQLGAEIQVYDPVAMDVAKKILDGVTFTDSPVKCAKDAQAVILVTEWQEFFSLDYLRIKSAMLAPYILYDGRNLLAKHNLVQVGFDYQGVGR